METVYPLHTGGTPVAPGATRRESSVEEALVEMYLAGVSVQPVEDIAEALWGSRLSASTVRKLNQKIYGKIEDWRNRPIEGEYVYVWTNPT